jgi:hypothetical protein
MEEERRKYVRVKLKNGDIKGYSGKDVELVFLDINQKTWLIVQRITPPYENEGWSMDEVESFQEREI